LLLILPLVKPGSGSGKLDFPVDVRVTEAF
jgi:hypothetical protein